MAEAKSVILDMAKLPGIRKYPWDEREAEINRRLTLLYAERQVTRTPATYSHIAAVLGVDQNYLSQFRNGTDPANAGDSDFQKYAPGIKDTLEAWIVRFDALCQDIMSTKDIYQPAMYLQKAHFGHSDNPEAQKEKITLSFELIRGELEKAKAEIPASMFPGLFGNAQKPAEIQEPPVDVKPE